MAEVKLPEIAESILLRIEREIDAAFIYHNIRHTREVVEQAALLAREDELPERDLELIVIAAAFHDSGFLEGQPDHERRGALWARQAMLDSGTYSNEEAELVEKMIMDTRLVKTDTGLVQKPSTRLSAYLLDADLWNLGQPHFMECSDLIRRESGAPMDAAFTRFLKDFMKSHMWHSPAARKLWGEGKNNNLRSLK